MIGEYFHINGRFHTRDETPPLHWTVTYWGSQEDSLPCVSSCKHLNGSGAEKQRAASVRRIPKLETTFLWCRTAVGPLIHTHTPPPPAPPPPLPTCTTSFLISDYIDSTCFGMLNSPYTGIALAITKGQQSSTLRFLNRALSQRVGTRESSRVKNAQELIEPIFDISLLSSTARRHEIWMISQENVPILLEFQARGSYRACSYL